MNDNKNSTLTCSILICELRLYTQGVSCHVYTPVSPATLGLYLDYSEVYLSGGLVVPVIAMVTLKAGGITTVNDDVIKGTLRVGSTVEIKQDPKKDPIEAVISKIQDCSQYTVVFDDGDITTLRRSALCLKSGRHFNESETLDQLPLTHPEHFSTPVIAGRRGRRGRAQSDESEGEGSIRSMKADSAEREPHVGRVVLVESASGAERRRPHQPAFPALVVAPTAQIKVKEDYLVRSFKDGRYYTVPKKEAREFRKGSAPPEWCGVEAALQYLNNGVLPPHWDRDSLFNEPRNTSDDSSDDEPREEKDHFVAQLYKFMDDRGTPLNRNPTIANKDIDLYRLFRVVQKLGGYNRVTNQNQWKSIADKMGFHPVTTTITNLCKQAYKKYLGVTLVAHPRGARTPPAGRSLIRDRDKQLPPATGPATSTGSTTTTSSTPSTSNASTPTSTSTSTSLRSKDKDSDKSETEKSEKSEKEEKIEKPKEKPVSDEEDSADNQPLVPVSTAHKIEKEKDKEKDKSSTTSEEKVPVKSRSQSKTRSLPPIKTESHERRTPKRRPLSSKLGESFGGTTRASRRPHVSTDSDSSGRASRPSSNEPTRPRGCNVKAQVGDKLKVYYGPTQSESKVTYEAKVIEISREGMLRVHYTGWNTRYDEWIKPQRIALNVTQHEATNKKSGGGNRRARSKRSEESTARSDSDSDSDSDLDVKRPPKNPDDKSSIKTPPISKDAKSSDSSGSSKPRKRPSRTVSTTSSVSPAKKPRTSNTTQHQHQGRDYDLNEIRSELKGLHSVKQELEEVIKTENQPNETMLSAVATTSVPAPEPVQPEKHAEDVYEFKEPEPFEFELHDEKKKRMHRIFDDISPTKYTSTLSKSLSEEISEEALRPRPPSFRSPSLSPFRDFAGRDASGRQSPEDDSKDGLFSLDDDSLPGESSSGPIFEGFTPAKNQETYSKKNKVTKLRELIDDSPDSPADDERSSEDEPDLKIKVEPREASSIMPSFAIIKIEDITNDETEEQTEPTQEVQDAITLLKQLPPLESIPMPPNTPPPLNKPDPESRSTSPEPNLDETDSKYTGEESSNELINILNIPLPTSEPTDTLTLKLDKENLDTPIADVLLKIGEPASSPIDTEEDKSEPDSPARIDVLPEPPPGFLLQSEGPKIAEKLLKAINSAKRLSMSPPPAENTPDTTKKDNSPLNAFSEKISPLPISESKSPVPKTELLVPPNKIELTKRLSPAEIKESVFGEPSNITDAKRDLVDIKKVKPKESSPPRLMSPLNILERRKSVADLQLAPGKNNKVLSDTIQKLSSQINQSVTAASITLPTYQPEDRSASVVVAGGSRAVAVVAGEDDSNLSLLLCEETIPGERRISERDSPSERKDEDDDRAHDNNLEADKPRDPSWDGQTRIKVLMSRLTDLRKAYHSVKAELAAIDRRRKKLRRKEREAVKAAKLACS
ncbi:unnamed protein product [Leptidea sinapis]|uniref:ARID domain-containing protein n=1 Tax=Leptidea sinapis TaxID=189913 RepID=A0A5E4QV23_9NEOP|nr:unnamed protein product [Leptidea sinapis]